MDPVPKNGQGMMNGGKAADSSAQQSRIPRPPVKIDWPTIGWMPLFGDSEENKEHPTWEDVMAMNSKRLSLLGLARNTTPIDTVARFSLLPRTVLPRLINKPLVWVIIGSFFATAFMARSGNEYFAGHADLAHDILEGSGSFVSFTIVFYVGYCYTRYTNQFDDVQLIMNSIVNACLSARATFSDQQEVHRLWRYLNLLHVSAYCGMTDYLTKDNVHSLGLNMGLSVLLSLCLPTHQRARIFTSH